MSEKRTFLFAFIAISVLAVSTTGLAGYYYIQYNTYHSEYQDLAERLNVMSQILQNFTDKLYAMSQIVDQLSNTTGSLQNDTRLSNDILEAMSVRASILIKHDAATLEWHNATYLPLGSTAFTQLMAVANITYESYVAGSLVTSINGVKNNATMGWFWWYWNSTSTQWSFPLISSDNYILQRGDLVAWAYDSYDTWPPPTPT